MFIDRIACSLALEPAVRFPAPNSNHLSWVMYAATIPQSIINMLLRCLHQLLRVQGIAV
jgi:hypothetical protein